MNLTDKALLKKIERFLKSNLKSSLLDFDSIVAILNKNGFSISDDKLFELAAYSELINQYINCRGY